MATNDVRLIVYVAHEYPARSQTFVSSEARALRDLGYDVRLYPMTWSDLADRESWVMPWTGLVKFFYLLHLIRSLGQLVLRLPAARRQFALPPHSLRQKLRFGKALLLAVGLATLARSVSRGRKVHLHAHFFGLMSEVALLARLMLPQDATVSIAGHAGDVVNARSRRRLIWESERADLVACASNHILAELLASGSAANARVIRCGVPTHGAIAYPFSRPDNLLRIVVVARLVEKKGIDDLIAALEVLTKMGDLEVVCRIIGDGPEREHLAELARSAGLEHTLLMLGERDRPYVFQILAEECDLFVLPSKVAKDGDADGIPVALMEAMSFSIPVVATATGGISELVADGETGFIVPSGNPVALAGRLLEIAGQTEKAIEVGKRGKEFVARYYSTEREADALASAIKDLGR